MNQPCTPAITFNYQDWAAMFPALKDIPEQQVANNYFVRAEGICANSTSNPVWGAPGKLKLALYLLTAHIAQLNAAQNGQPANPTLVGRIGSATQGSVTVQVEWDGTGAPGEAWFTQTQYGAEYWTLMAGTRTAYYIPRPTRVPLGLRYGARCFWA